MIAPEMLEVVVAARAAKRAARLRAGRARTAVLRAVADGRLRRPTSCTRCPNPGPVEAHHFMGYEERNWLSVLWLCKPCHAFAERVARVSL